MRDKVNKELEKKRRKALANVKVQSRIVDEKQEKKFWSNIEIPFTLMEGLTKYTKSELDEIRKSLQLKNVSSLKKDELITLLQEKIPDSLEQICLQWEKDRFRLLMKIARNGGYIDAPDLDFHQIQDFRSSGFIYSGSFKDSKTLAVPVELIAPIMSLEDDEKVESCVDRNTDWIQLTNNILSSYEKLSAAQLELMLDTIQINNNIIMSTITSLMMPSFIEGNPY